MSPAGDSYYNSNTYWETTVRTFGFHIIVLGREPFTFDNLSSGYAAVLDIVVDLMVRMEKKADKRYNLDEAEIREIKW